MKLTKIIYACYASLILVLICSCTMLVLSATAGEFDYSSSSVVFKDTDQFDSQDREYSELERQIAQQLISTGQMLEGDARFEDVVSSLAQRGQSFLPSGSNLTQDWVRENLREILPAIDNKMAAAALNAATGEIAQSTGSAANGLAQSMTGLSGEDTPDLGGNLTQTALRSGLEGAKAAAAASDLYALNHLELEYSLSEGGLDEYSVLSVQPLWDSTNLRHNVFAQASYANKQVEDIGADTSGRRDTVNAGLAYRYITPDVQHMFGANAFFDHQWPYHHNRMSLGLDYKTSLYGLAFNKYIGLSDWRGREDGYEEKALGGEDLELSGRFPQAPDVELFAKVYHWSQEKTAVLNPDGTDIKGYQFAAEYTPVNGFTIRSETTKDNEMDDMEGQITLRLNYRFGDRLTDLWERPSYNLDNVMERRFDKVRRTNEIRVQVRQDPDITARVTFAQGANVSAGQSLAFGTTITTGGAAGEAVTLVFGNNARLDVGQSTQVRVDADQIVLITGMIQFTSGSGGITAIAVPGGTIDLIGTDVDVRVAGSTTLRVRDGAADFTDETGTTRVNTEELAESQNGDSSAPQIRAEGTAIYETHASAAHTQLDLVGPAPSNAKAAPYATEAVSVTGTLATGNTLTFTVPLSASVIVTGSPQLRFTLGGVDRRADYASGSGTSSLVFTYTLVAADETLSNIVAEEIEKNGGTLIGTNGAPMVRTVSGGLSGAVPDATAPTIASVAVSSRADPAALVALTVNMSEAVTVDTTGGTPRIGIDVGGVTRYASYASGTGTSALSFSYQPVAGDLDLDGVTLISPLELNGGSIKDAEGNDATLTFAVPDTSSVEVDYPSLNMDFTADSSGNYTLNGTSYTSFASFLSAAGGTFTNDGNGTYYDSSGTLRQGSANTPRFDHDPVTHEAKGILIEESRQNRMFRSAEFDNAFWNKSLEGTLIVASNVALAPDGTMSADKISAGGINGRHLMLSNGGGNVSSGITYAISIYAKAAEQSSFQLSAANACFTSNLYANFNLATGSVGATGGSILSVQLINIGNGWYRAILVATANSSACANSGFVFGLNNNNPTASRLPPYTGDGSSGIYIWGAQMEVGSFATSYIPTTTAAVTRTSDLLTMPFSTSGPLTTLARVSKTGAVSNDRILSLDNGSNAEAIKIRYGATLNPSLVVVSGNVVQTETLTSVSYLNTNVAIAGAFASNDVRGAKNGVLTSLDSTVSIPSVTTLRLGHQVSGTEIFNGYISNISLYPIRAADTQMQLLTQ